MLTNGLGWLTPNQEHEKGNGKPPQYCPMTPWQARSWETCFRAEYFIYIISKNRISSFFDLILDYLNERATHKSVSDSLKLNQSESQPWIFVTDRLKNQTHAHSVAARITHSLVELFSQAKLSDTNSGSLTLQLTLVL